MKDIKDLFFDIYDGKTKHPLDWRDMLGDFVEQAYTDGVDKMPYEKQAEWATNLILL